MKKLLSIILGLLVLGWCLLSVVVDLESEPRLERLANGGEKKALIFFHPSWLDSFQEELTVALASGLKEEGWTVDRQTVNSNQLADVEKYHLIIFGTNTYYWRPDLPTKRVLKKIDLQGKPCVGLVSGAGSTRRAERILKEALTAARRLGRSLAGNI